MILDGSASSDANGDKLTYKWAIISTPSDSKARLSDATSAKPSFTADLAGVYVFSLQVNDGKLDSPFVTTTVTASAANVAPVANAGLGQNVVLGTVTLDASASSDANGDKLSYKWALISAPSDSKARLSDANSAKPSFTADFAGVYVFSLQVNDGKLDSPVVTTTVTASAANVAPVANAGSIQSVVLGPVTLDGSSSTDANKDTLTYKWVLIAKPIDSKAELSPTNSAKPSFTADLVGVYVASLVVNDGKLDSAIVTTTVTASAANVAPVANAGPYQNVVTGTRPTLDGSASSDANGDTLKYKWVMISSPLESKASLSLDTDQKPRFLADQSGTYVFSLQVNDGKVSSPLSYVTITAGAANMAPVANAGTAQNVRTGVTVYLNGSLSNDANGDTLIYNWTMTYRPPGSGANLYDTNAISPSFQADLPGVYVFTLMVSDGRLNSNLATVAITATAP